MTPFSRFCRRSGLAHPLSALPLTVLACLIGTLAWPTLAVADTSIIDPDPALQLPDDLADIRALAQEQISASASDNLVNRLRQGFVMPTRSDNPRVARHHQWLGSKQAYLDTLMLRASRYLHLTVSEAERRQLPTELALLPVIESSYNPMAVSRSGAAGLWQFIPDTGRLFGLRQTALYDGRRDPVEATRAAYDYLSQLYATFGDWELVLAAYNAGPGTVSRAMKRNAAAGLPTDYWSLPLPEETQNYVPRFLAVAALFREPERMGLSLRPIANRPHFRTVRTNGPVTLAAAAEAAGVSVQTLRELNPGLSREQMDPKGPYHVHVPASLDVASENRIAQLTPMIPGYFSVDRRLASLADPAPVAAALPVVMRQETPGRHRVQAKETWYAIARTYNVPPAVLTAANQSSLKTPLEVGRELVIPNTGSTPAATSGARIITVASQNTAANAQDSRIEIIRRVLPGETLESIRRQYQVTLAELRAWNGDLQSLTAGQTLILRLLPDAALPRSL